MANKIPQIHALGAGDYGSKNKVTLGDVVSQVPAVLDTVGKLVTNVIPSIITYGVKEAINAFAPQAAQNNVSLYDWMTKSGWVAQLQSKIDLGADAGLISAQDPYQINSALDLLAPGYNPDVAKKYGKDTALTRIVAGLDSYKKYILNPMLKGEFSKVGINALMSLGEGLNMLANPIKAALAFEGNPLYRDAYFEDYDTALSYVSQVAQGQCETVYDENGDVAYYKVIDPKTNQIKSISTEDYESYSLIVNTGRTANIKDLNVWERLASSIGAGDNGRVEYNFDSGSLLADFIGEVAVDPSTWFTFGLSSLGKAGVKATRAGVKDALKIAGSQSDEIAAGIMRVGEDRIFAAANKFLAEKEISVAAKSDIAPVLARFLKDASNDTATHSFKIKNFDDAFNAAMAYHGIYTKATNMDIIRLINKAKATQRARMTNTILRTVETSNNVLGKVMWWAGGLTTGLAPTVKLLRGTNKAVAHKISQQLDAAVQPYLDKQGACNIMCYDDVSRIFDQAMDNAAEGLNPSELAALNDLYNKGALFEEQSNRVCAQINSIVSSKASAKEQLEQLKIVLKDAYDTTSAAKVVAQYKRVIKQFPDAKYLQEAVHTLEQVAKLKKYLTKSAKYGDAHEIAEYIFTSLIKEDPADANKIYQGPIRVQLSNVREAISDAITQYIGDGFSTVLTPLLVRRIKTTILEPAKNAYVSELQRLHDRLLKILPNEASVIKDAFHQYTYPKMYNDYVQLIDNIARTLDEQVGISLAEFEVILNKELYFADPRVNTVYRDLITKDAEHAAAAAEKFAEWRTLVMQNILATKADAFVPTSLANVQKLVQTANKAQQKLLQTAQQLNKDLNLPVVKKKGASFERPDLQELLTRAADEAVDTGALEDVLYSDQVFFTELYELFDKEYQIENVEAFFSDNIFAALINPDKHVSEAELQVYLENFKSIERQVQQMRDALYKRPEKSAETMAEYRNQGWEYRLTDAESPDVFTVRSEKLQQAEALLKYYDISNYVLDAPQLVLFEDMVELKLTQIAQTDMLLDHTSGLTDLVSLLSSGTFTKFVDNLKVVKDSNAELYQALNWDIIDKGVVAASQIRTQVPAMIALRNTIMHGLGLSDEQAIALYNAITKRYYLTPDQIATSYTAQTILEDAVKNDMFTNHSTRRLSLEEVGARDPETLNKLRAQNGFAPLEDGVYETHIAAEDSINNFMLHKELIESDSAYAAAVAGKRTVFVDIETQNEKTALQKNQIHSVAIMEYDAAGNIVKRYTIALDAGKTTVNVNYAMLGKLYPDLDAGARAEQYIADLSKQASDGLYKDSTELARAARNYLLSTYDTADTCIIGHNIAAFDAPILNKNVNDIRYADSTQLFGYQTVDTYTAARGKYAAGTISFTTEQADQITALLQIYAHQLQQSDVTAVFTPITTEQLTNLKNMFREFNEHADLYSQADIDLFTAAKKPISKIGESLNMIRTNNAGLRSVPLPKQLFVTGNALPEEQLQKLVSGWTEYFKSMGMSAEDITARFGDSLTALSTTSVLGACDATRSLAVKNILSPDMIKQWFNVTPHLVDGYMPYKTAMVLQGTAKSLQRREQQFGALLNVKAFSPDIRAQYLICADQLYARFANAESTLFPELKDMLPYVQLTDSQKFAVASYIVDHAPGKLGLSAEQVFTEDIIPADVLWFFANRSYTDTARYADMLSSLEVYRIYKQAQIDFNANKITLDQLAEIKDANGCIGAAHTVRMRALEPLFDFIDSIGSLEGKALITFSKIDMDAGLRRAKLLISDVLHTPPEQMKTRLAYSHGVIRIDTHGLQMQEVKEMLSAYNTPELQAAGVYTYIDEQSNSIWFTLDAKAGINSTIDTDLKRARIYTADGTELESYAFGSTPAAACYGAVKNAYGAKLIDTEKFEAAEATLISATDGALIGSDYTLMTAERLKALYESMPKQVREHYDYNTFSKGAFFKTLVFNRSDLSVTSSPLTVKLYDAAQRTMEMARADTLYKQCMFSDFSAIKNSSILGNLIRNNPADVAKAFRKNGAYVGASLATRRDGTVLIKTYDLGNPVELQACLKEGGQIFDYTEYAQIYDVINNHMWSDAKFKAWRQVMAVYKIGTLVNPGTWLRNIEDTLIKNMEVTGDVAVVKYHFKAARALSAFEEHAKNITLARSAGEVIDSTWLDAYFRGSKNMTRAEYDEIQHLMGIGVFGGETKTFTKLEREHQKKLLEGWLKDQSIDLQTYTKYAIQADLRKKASWLLAPMEYTENIARYALYYALKDQGFGINAIAKKIADTHFDYANKTALEHTMEYIMPFYTFQRRNLNYWLGVAEDNPMFMAQLCSMLEPLMDIGQYSPEDLENNNLVQYHVLAGNIKLSDNFYLNTSFSFMDACNRITDILGSRKDSVFNPLNILIDVVLQGGADEAYRSGYDMLSNWMQNAFGLKMTEEQVLAKYGTWTENFYALTNYEPSGTPIENLKRKLTKNQQWLTLIPAVGTQMQRFWKTAHFWDDEHVLGSLFSLAGIGNPIPDYVQESSLNYAAKKAQYRSWLEVFGYAPDTYVDEYGRDIRTMSLEELKAFYRKVTEEYKEREGLDADQPVSAIYVLLQDDQKRFLYSRMKAAMGYADTKYSDLPDDIKQALYWTLTNQTDLSPCIPILQDQSVMLPMWRSLASKYNVSLDDIDSVPNETLVQMYSDVAKSVVTISNITSMLQDERYRAAYKTSREMLGLENLKLSQLPCDILELIEKYMQGHPAASRSSKHRTSGYYKAGARGRVYHTMSYSNLGTPAFEMRNLNMHGTPQRNSYAANKYGVRSHQAGYRKRFYKNLYTKSGKSRLQLRMIPITPDNLKYRIKDNFYYINR